MVSKEQKQIDGELRHLSRAEQARKLGISAGTLYRWMRKGTLRVPPRRTRQGHECRVPSCSFKPQARGLCWTHLQQFYRGNKRINRPTRKRSRGRG